MHRWVRPPRVNPEYSSFLIRKNRYLVMLARVSPRRNNRSRAQTSIFAVENLMSSTRARRQEARKCRPEEDRKSMKSFNSHCFFQYFCSPAPVHEGMNHTKTIHFLLVFSIFLLSCIRARRQKKYESHSFPILFGISASGPGILGFGHWALDLWILDSGLWI